MTKPLVPEDRSLPPYRGPVEFNVLCRHMLVGGGDGVMAHASAEADASCPRRVVEVLRAAVGPGSLIDPVWAGALGGYRQTVAAFVESLASVSFFDRALSDNAFVKVPPRTPIVIVTQSAIGSTVAEGAPTPVSSMTLAVPSVPLKKAITDVVVTNEVARDPASTGLIGRELRTDTAKATDTSAIATIIAAGTSTPTLGNTVGNLVSDLQSMFADIEIGEQSRLYFVLNAALAAALSARLAGSVGWDLTPTGGTLAGVQTIVSSGVPTGDLVLVDASRFAAFSDVITLAASNQGLLQMNTAPDSPPTSATPYTNLFQENKTSLRAIRYFGLVALTATAAATTTGMS